MELLQLKITYSENDKNQNSYNCIRKSADNVYNIQVPIRLNPDYQSGLFVEKKYVLQTFHRVKEKMLTSAKYLQKFHLVFSFQKWFMLYYLLYTAKFQHFADRKINISKFFPRNVIQANIYSIDTLSLSPQTKMNLFS